ncbi:unnamed protein product [Mortierella alpina]
MSESTTSSNPVLLTNHINAQGVAVSRRWDFKHGQVEAERAGPSTRPTSPLVRSDTPWEDQLPLDNIAVGWYSLVFSVSFENMNFDLLKSITFDAKLGDDGKGTGVKSVVRKEEIEERLPAGRGPRLLRLHRPLNVSDGSKDLAPRITIQAAAESVTPLSFELHHIELTTDSIQPSSNAKEPVHILYEDDKPHHYIIVGDSSNHPVKICAYAISDMGNHVVTLHLVNNTALLDIWKIENQDDNSQPGRPHPLTAHCARASFPLGDGSGTPDLIYEVAISSTGLQAAFCALHTHGKPPGPISIYEYLPIVVSDHASGQPWPLHKSAVTEALFASAYGHIAFRTIDPASNEPKHERFFKFDGRTFDIYKATGRWHRIFSLPTSIESKSEAMLAKILFHSIRGQFFAYTGTRGFVTIWNFEKSRIVSNIPVPVDKMPVRASLSRDGAMVAIATKGAIRVHDVQSGIRLGYLKESLNETNEFEMDFEQDHLTILNYTVSAVEHGSQPKTRRVLRVRDMSVLSTYEIQPEYCLQTPQAIGAHIFAFDQGAMLDIIKHEPYSTAEEVPSHTKCCVNVVVNIFQVLGKQLDLTLDDTVFKVKALNSTTNSSSEATSVWNLSVTSASICELAYIWKLHSSDLKDTDDVNNPQSSENYNHHTILTAKTCEHGRSPHITLSLTQRKPSGRRFPGVSEKKHDITVPVSSEYTLMLPDNMHLVSGVQYLVSVYAESDSSVRKSILRYLMSHIHPWTKHSVSSLVSLCEAWSPDTNTCLMGLVSELLPPGRVTWIPHLTSRGQNPLAILLAKIKQEPDVLWIVKSIINYCAKNAVRTKDPSFLAPIFACMPRFMKLLPDNARDFLREFSYIPTKQRAFILHNHVIVHPPKIFLKFWKLKKKSLAKTEYPILQLNDSPSEPNRKNNIFRRPLYVASFNMLWNYKDNTATKAARPNDNTWWKTLYHILTIKLRLRTHTYVECHNFNSEVFDNPAIAALVSYKWNTIGFAYWLFRFAFQLIFYSLVMAAALMQVYHVNVHVAQLRAVFFFIIAFGTAFLWLELLQAIKHGKRYRTIYNLLDILGYALPVIMSIHQIIVLPENNPNSYIKTLSASVLVVSLHALFELRVFKSVCKYVSIIQHSVVETRAFLLIFAAGIVAFTIAILHLLKGCPIPGECTDPPSQFPAPFLRALSATFFFLGGSYDSVSGEFDSQGWEFHILMSVYFFFTVVVMLNVLIALLNVAFIKGDERWFLVWNESRLRSIEAAENMSYEIPGFRELNNWFPNEIFYSATLQEEKAYRKKYQSKKSKKQDREILQVWERDEEYDEDEEGNPLIALPQDQKPAIGSDSQAVTPHTREADSVEDGKADEDKNKEMALVRKLRGQVERLQRHIDEQAQLQQQRHEQSRKESQRQFEILQELRSRGL